jgi:hypothetical protein
MYKIKRTTVQCTIKHCRKNAHYLVKDEDTVGSGRWNWQTVPGTIEPMYCRKHARKQAWMQNLKLITQTTPCNHCRYPG